MAAPDDKDAAKPARTEERTTERRMVATTAVSIAPESARDVTGEDFLFHLYRGSELLQDNRIHEAKEELEQALTHQPRDAKGQDLLAVVYFRLGLYPRAIQIYEDLKHDAPGDVSLSVNLALCYLKTGQAQNARRELEEVVTAQPTHKRAWGYLGLAYERLGDVEKALHAFERGGHPAMAQRLTGKTNARSLRAIAEQNEVRSAAAAAFEELDAGEVTFSIAEPITGSKAASGTWRTVELGQSSRPSAMPQADRWSVPPSAAADSGVIDEPPSPSREARGLHAPSGLAEIIERARLTPPREPGLVVHSDGFAIARTGEAPKEHPFAARVDAIRAQSAKLGAEVLSRHQRGKSTGEPFGGLASPLVRISGVGEVVVAPRPGHTLVAFSLKDDTVYTREEALLGFELSLSFENGKLPMVDGGESAAIVQLRGTGSVLFELVEAMGAVEVAESRPLLARHDAVFAWTSRVTPRSVPIAEAPSGQRGLLSFSGHGFVLLTR